MPSHTNALTQIARSTEAMVPFPPKGCDTNKQTQLSAELTVQEQHCEVLLPKCSDLWETDRKIKRTAGKFNYRRTTQKLTLFRRTSQ